MPTRNVHLTEHFDDFIASGVDAGRYSNASETVRAGLRLLEQQEREDEAKLAWLRNAAEEAFASLDRGEGILLDGVEDLDKFLAKVTAEARAISAKRRE